MIGNYTLCNNLRKLLNKSVVILYASLSGTIFVQVFSQKSGKVDNICCVPAG